MFSETGYRGRSAIPYATRWLHEARTAVVPADTIAEVGQYNVTVKSKGEAIPESYPAPLTVKFKK